MLVCSRESVCSKGRNTIGSVFQEAFAYIAHPYSGEDEGEGATSIRMGMGLASCVSLRPGSRASPEGRGKAYASSDNSGSAMPMRCCQGAPSKGQPQGHDEAGQHARGRPCINAEFGLGFACSSGGICKLASIARGSECGIASLWTTYLRALEARRLVPRGSGE